MQIDNSGTSEDKSLSLVFICHLINKVFDYLAKQFRLIWKLHTLNFSYDKKIIIAIDHTATYFANRFTKNCPVIFWSFDVLAEDAPWRIKNGFLEKLITSKYALQTDKLMIQDANRKKLLEESVGKVFDQTIYMPVGLNDSNYCRFAAAKRAGKKNFESVKIIQCGLLSEIRLTVELIDVYQNWPFNIELYLHGIICGNAVNNKLMNVTRKSIVSSERFDSNSLSKFLDGFDIGFVGYGETDSNFKFNENASAQLVSFLRLGIPVIVCGSQNLNEFITEHRAGLAITSLGDMQEVVKQLTDNYAFYCGNARRLYEKKFNLISIFESCFIPSVSGMV
jgi:hypothetical protein